MNISILIPWRTDNGHRARLFAYTRTLWDLLNVEVVVGDHPGPGPFNAAYAFNRAAEQATGDVFLLFGADQLPSPPRIAWANEHLASNAWCALYANTGHYSQADTEAILAGTDANTIQFDTILHHCTAILGIRREAWADAHGMDERFNGWGHEDYALRLKLEHLYGPTPQPEGTLACLWHPPAPTAQRDRNWALAQEYEQAATQGRMRDYVNSLTT